MTLVETSINYLKETPVEPFINFLKETPVESFINFQEKYRLGFIKLEPLVYISINSLIVTHNDKAVLLLKIGHRFNLNKANGLLTAFYPITFLMK